MTNSTVPGVNATHHFTKAGTFDVQLINTYGGCYDTITKKITVSSGAAITGFITDKSSSCKAPLTVQFEDTTTGAVRWHWNFGTGVAGDTSNEKAPSFTFTQSKNHTVTLTVTNAAGCQTSATKIITIAPATITIAPTKSSSIHGLYGCPGLSINFKSFPEGGLKNYRWDFGDGGSSTEAEPQHTFNGIGQYTVKLVYTTAAGCEDSVVYTNYVRTYQKPVVDFESLSGLSICGNTPVKFADRTDTATSWHWDFGDGGTSNLKNPVHSYSSEGDFSVKLIATNQYCSDTLLKKQFIKLTPPFPSISGIVKNCSDRGTLTLSQASVGAKKLEWNFGDGSANQTFTTEQLQVSHTYTKSGVYKVFLYTSNDQCTTYDTMYVSVHLKQRPKLIADKKSLCGSDTLAITVTGLEPIQYYYAPSRQTFNYPYTGRWEYSDGTVISNTNSFAAPGLTQKLTHLRPGKDSIRLITYDGIGGCYDTSDYVSVTVSGPIASFTKDAAIKCARAPIQFTDASSGTGGVPIAQWIWNFGDGRRDTLTRGGSISHRYEQTGAFYPALKVVDANGCYAQTAPQGNQVTVYGPLANFHTLDTAVSPGQPVRFVNTTDTWPGYPVTYTWDFGDGNTSAQFAPTHRYTATGYYTVKLIARSTFGCVDSLVRLRYIEVKTVKSAFKINASYVNSNSCPPLLARFVSNAVNADSLFWDFGDLSYADNVRTPNHTYFQPGVYKVYLYAFGKGGVVDTAMQEVTVNGPYGTVETNKLKGCVPTEISLTAHATNAVNYTWDFGDGSVSQGDDTVSVYTYTDAGIYQPRVIMKDAAGCTATFRVKDSIIIDDITANIQPDLKLICDVGTVTFGSEVANFSHDSLKKDLQYHWNFGTGNAGDTANTLTGRFHYDKPGKYAVSFSAQSIYGCTGVVRDTITVFQKPQIAVSALASVCQKDSVRFGAVANMANLNWRWNFGNGVKDTVQRPAAKAFADSGTYSVEVVAFNNPACADTAIQTIVVNALPQINLSPRDTLICKGDAITLQAHNGALYQWTSNNPLPQNNISAIKVAPAQSSFYRVRVTTAAGCRAEDSLKITVSQPFDVTVKPTDVTVCAGTMLPLKATGAVRYQWLPADGLNNSSIDNPLAKPLATTQYKVVGYGADACFTDTALVNVTVIPLPKVTASNDTTVMVGSVVPLRALTSNDVTRLSWMPAEYLSCTTCATPISTPREPMAYTVTVANAFGCTAADSVQIHLQCANSVVFIPNTFTPNGDGVNDVFYPRGVDIKSVRYFRIFDRWGELIFEKGSFGIDDIRSGWDGTFRGKALPTAVFVYTAEMICDNGEVFKLKGSIMLVR